MYHWDFGLYNQSAPFPINVTIGLVVWFAFAFVYVVYMNIRFEVEKLLWIDSFFDNRSLTTRQSWKLARHLMVSVVSLWATVFIRYFMLPIILLIAFTWVWTVSVVNGFDALTASEYMFFVIPFVSLLPLGFFVYYAYKTTVRLRFIGFIFLDSYGEENYSIARVLARQESINAALANKHFWKAMLLTVGFDTVTALSAAVTAQLISSITTRLLGKGNVIGPVVESYSKEYIAQVGSLSKLIAMRILYREAKHFMSEQPDHVNEHVYKLAK